MGLDLGGPALIEGARTFGFNETPPLDLPAVASRFPEVDFSEQLPTLAQSAIGQYDVAATPLQMALVAAGVANDGLIMEPHVVDEIRDGEGELVGRVPPFTCPVALSTFTRATHAVQVGMSRSCPKEVARPRPVPSGWGWPQPAFSAASFTTLA